MQNDPQAWQTLDQQYVYRFPWLTVRKERVRLENGAEIPDYYVLEYTDWVNAALVTENRQVLLIRIYRHGLGKVNYELPGGCVDPDESPLDAAKRETLEETGYQAKNWQQIGVCCANPATHNNKTYLFLADHAVKVREPELEHTEEIISHLVDIDDIPTLLDQQHVISASHALCLATVHRKLGQNK